MKKTPRAAETVMKGKSLGVLVGRSCSWAGLGLGCKRGITMVCPGSTASAQR